jgi:HSP20 family protein
MPIFRWGQAWDPFGDFERQLDQMLHGMQLFHGVRSGRRFPQLNVVELDEAYVVTAEIPGVSPGQIEVTTDSRYLTIRGTRQPAEEAREDSFRRQERFCGQWQRKIELPDRVDEEGMKADYVAGILRIILPKAPSTVARQITVNEGP